MWSHIERCANQRLHDLVVIEVSGETEVDELAVIFMEDDVRGLQITVDVALLSDFLQGSNNLSQVAKSTLLWKRASFEETLEVEPIAVLSHDVGVIKRVVNIEKLHDIGVAKLAHDLDFLRSDVGLRLVDDLDGDGIIWG